MNYVKNFRLNWFDLLTVVGLVVTGLFIYLGYHNGIFDSRESLIEYVESFGAQAIIVFIFIQFLQVILPILPAAVTCVAGVILFGPVWGIFYNYVGICIGSFGAFLISKRYGQPLVEKMLNEKIFKKYSKWLNDSKVFDRVFAIGIFGPLAPDDALCYLAGLTQMSLKKFGLIILFGKPIPIALYSLGWSTIVNWLDFF
ncbi:MAG: TVP38/TMEM64 family protein [Desemzia incerta]|uniref:TVP38/TMEM64 family protein n=1 Tax=Desemzia incerta TaxID=82801 RepID=UPI0033159C04